MGAVKVFAVELFQFFEGADAPSQHAEDREEAIRGGFGFSILAGLVRPLSAELQRAIFDSLQLSGTKTSPLCAPNYACIASRLIVSKALNAERFASQRPL